MLGADPLGLAGVRLRLCQVVHPDIAPRRKADVPSGAAIHDDVAHGIAATEAKRLVDDGLSGSGLPPRICSSAVMTATAPASTMRSCNDFAEKPPNTTECVAPIRAHACIAVMPSIDIGM